MKDDTNCPHQVSAAAPRDQVKIEFATRLQNAMVAKGLNQTELARRTAAYMPVDEKTGKRQRFGRDNVSTYIRGKALPGVVPLAAMCKVLGRQPDELLPTRGAPSNTDRFPTFAMRDMGNGEVWLQVNKSAPWDIAIEVAKLLNGPERGD